MNLLTTLSALPAGFGASASCDATSSGTDGGAGGSSCGEEGTFLATLTALSGPLPSADDAVVADLGEDAERAGEVATSLWPLAALLGEGEVAPTVTIDDPEDAPRAGLGGESRIAEVEPPPAAPAETETAGGSGVLTEPTLEAPEAETVVVRPAVPEPSARLPQSPSGVPVASDETAAPAPASGRAAVGEPGPMRSEPIDADDAGANPLRPPGATDRGRSTATDQQPSDPSRPSTVQRPVAPTTSDTVAELLPDVDGAVGDMPSAPGTSASGPQGSRIGLADGVRRVLEAIELLENAPPPRQLTIDVGEARLRVAIEDGQVRLTVLDGGSDDVDDLVRVAEQALAEQGFDLGRDGSGQRTSDDDHPPTTDRQRARTTRSVSRGLRL